ncbi:hypothetical protein JB92DRAFT_3054236, partial [Gautieria morchelliformis]
MITDVKMIQIGRYTIFNIPNRLSLPALLTLNTHRGITCNRTRAKTNCELESFGTRGGFDSPGCHGTYGRRAAGRLSLSAARRPLPPSPLAWVSLAEPGSLLRLDPSPRSGRGTTGAYRCTGFRGRLLLRGNFVTGGGGGRAGMGGGGGTTADVYLCTGFRGRLLLRGKFGMGGGGGGAGMGGGGGSTGMGGGTPGWAVAVGALGWGTGALLGEEGASPPPIPISWKPGRMLRFIAHKWWLFARSEMGG